MISNWDLWWLTGFCLYLVPLSPSTHKILWCTQTEIGQLSLLCSTPSRLPITLRYFPLAHNMPLWSGPWCSSDLTIFMLQLHGCPKQFFHGLPTAKAVIPQITIWRTLAVHLHLCSNVPFNKKLSLLSLRLCWIPSSPCLIFPPLHLPTSNTHLLICLPGSWSHTECKHHQGKNPSSLL